MKKLLLSLILAFPLLLASPLEAALYQGWEDAEQNHKAAFPQVKSETPRLSFAALETEEERDERSRTEDTSLLYSLESHVPAPAPVLYSPSLRIIIPLKKSSTLPLNKAPPV